MIDILSEAFIAKYGIKHMLEDVNAKKIHKSGPDDFICCCPFHDDKTESFSININNGLYQCFACSAKGNLVEFIKLSYNLDYEQAKAYLLARSGLDIENINFEDIAFKREIFNLTKDKTAEDELVKWPIISEDMVKRMYVGPDPYNYLLKRGFSEAAIKYFECGYSDDYLGTGYVKRKRITIPGHNEYGQLCGFIGRTPIDEHPKYLYTAGYPKSNTLFNLHRAKTHSAQGIIVVEGSLDAMRIHDLGYPNVTAILGSALSIAQQKLLIKSTNKVYFMFDNDAAGLKATMNAIEAMKNQLNTYYISLGKLKDPGEITSKENLDFLISNAKSWFKYELQKGGI